MFKTWVKSIVEISYQLLIFVGFTDCRPLVYLLNTIYAYNFMIRYFSLLITITVIVPTCSLCNTVHFRCVFSWMIYWCNILLDLFRFEITVFRLVTYRPQSPTSKHFPLFSHKTPLNLQNVELTLPMIWHICK